ncbi:nucleoside phosphatase gda1 cd39 [Trichoderma cornu-damae]|uniref:Nucleoside phosphatase gda1 cd39 n=1 Tax=Trichoderma cornu-damae TaxID=654480 RepID=A0A9P8TTZ8_9HYPO|nr:nucleoside phosphatase gda1 cd39 [Trichoderma cornu-damae]
MGQYGVILDAGSSGTRVYIYKWKDPTKALKQASASDAHTLPKLKLQKSKKIHPGVSSFAENAAAVGHDHLKALVDTALAEIPAAQVSETPIFLLATAGVRFLPKHQQTALLQGMCTYLRANTRFQLPDCASHVQVISGETEGLYGWIAANYLLGGFDKPDQHAHGKGHHTYGFLDMGGASAQIAFAPNATETAKHENDLKLVRLRRLDGSPAEYKVFTATWLGFGANKARERFVDSLQEQYGKAKGDIPDPCLPKGLRTTVTGEPLSSGTTSDAALVGTGMFSECLRKTYPLLGKDVPCEDDPCLLNGQHVPAIDFDVNHFIGVSEYWHTTHGVFGQESKVYDLVSYEQEVNDFCSQDWSVIESGLDKRKKTLEEKAENAREACFKASWLINVLYEGIGIPRIGLGDVPGQKVNATKGAVEKAKGKEFLDPFQPIDTIGGVEVSWTLGKMVLYAAGQIPPQGSPLPVGFGSNTGSETPADFEFAGSKPLLPNSYGNGDGDDNDDNNDDVLTSRSTPVSGLLVLMLVLLFIGYLLRRTEWGSRVISKFRRYRKARSSSFARRFFGRSSTTYERVMEEGDAGEFELGGTESDETDGSDGGETSRHVGGSRLSGSKSSLERFDDLRPPSAMDRHGLVLRTESCERLAPTLQMLNAGRRSRAGSPTRLKNSITIPQGS